MSERWYYEAINKIAQKLEGDRLVKVLDLYLQCVTQDEIAKIITKQFKQRDQTTIGRDIQRIKDMVSGKKEDELCNFAELQKRIMEANFNDFQPKLYNIWNYSSKENQLTYPGQLPEDTLKANTCIVRYFDYNHPAE